MRRAPHSTNVATAGAAGLAVVASLTLATFGPLAARAPSPQLRDLATLEKLGADFDAVAGAPRLVLLLSPT